MLLDMALCSRQSLGDPGRCRVLTTSGFSKEREEKQQQQKKNMEKNAHQL